MSTLLSREENGVLKFEESDLEKKRRAALVRIEEINAIPADRILIVQRVERLELHLWLYGNLKI